MAKISEHANAVRANVATQITALVGTAFALVAALAWNTAIQALFTHFFGTASTLVPMFSYAILVTVIAVVVTYYLSALANKKT